MRTSWLHWLPLAQPTSVPPNSLAKAAPSVPLTGPLSSFPPTAIAVSGITMVFQAGEESYPVLQGIDLDIASGSFQCLLGPSGVGKTTLLSILAGILTPTSGSVTLLGQTITEWSKSQIARFRLQHIGFIFQELNLIPSLTVLENVELAATVKGIDRAMARQQARSLLNQVNLNDKFSQLPRSLSGGEKQRVAVARALVGNPRLIFADEPTSALDFDNGSRVVNLLRQRAQDQNCTVLMSTHDHRFTQRADRILQLEDGQLQPQHPH